MVRAVEVYYTAGHAEHDVDVHVDIIITDEAKQTGRRGVIVPYKCALGDGVLAVRGRKHCGQPAKPASQPRN